MTYIDLLPRLPVAFVRLRLNDAAYILLHLPFGIVDRGKGCLSSGILEKNGS